MSQNAPSNSAGITLQGGAAIVAPISAFQGGVPSNALVVIPLQPNGQPIEQQIVDGPVALKTEDLWKMLGFNGRPVQVQDQEGNPITIGVDDLLNGLEENWKTNSDNLDAGRVLAQKLIEEQRFDRAEAVLGKIVAKGGGGEDWLGLGVTQLNLKKWEKAEATLKGAQNLLKDNPYPALHLAKCAAGKEDGKAEREHIERAIQIAPNAVDAWAYLYEVIKRDGSAGQAVTEIENLANVAVNLKTAAPYIALQGFYAGEEATRDQAIGYAKKAVERSPQDPLGLLCLSALYGQANQLDELIKLLGPQEAVLLRDVRLANNYFEALFQQRDIPKVTQFLNKLATSSNKEIKQFAIERSRAIAQMLSQQQQQLSTIS